MTRKNPERRQELIAAARQLFYTKGYKNSSVNDIIQAVGVSKGAFYHHFESKTAVLEAIVAQMVDQIVTNLQEIIADETLSAIPKWQKAIQISNSLKIERKTEMIEASRVIHRDENILLAHKIRIETVKVMTREMAKIIAQGVAEGVFDVEHIPETAEIMVVNISTLSETINEMIFNPEKYDDPATVALRKNAAVQTAVERLLGAPPGSMPIIDDETLIAWFAD